MNLRNPIVVFIARASNASSNSFAEKRVWLTRSLDVVKEHHESLFSGRFDGSSIETFVFIQSSNSPFRPAGDVLLFFEDLFNRAEQQDRDILLVVSGWDGLTTNQGAFQRLFQLRPEKVSVLLRIISVDLDRLGETPVPPRFYDVDPLQVCAVWAGDLDPEDLDVKFYQSTKQYLFMVPAISACKMRLSEDFQLLHELTHERNTHKWAGPRHYCGFEGCNEEFFTAGSRDTHRSREHQRPETEEQIEADKRLRTCQYCGKELSRRDKLVRHEKICSANPDREEIAGPALYTSRHRSTTDPITVHSVNKGAVKPYDGLQGDEVLKLPRIDPDNPIFYRRERFCRYPGCDYTMRHLRQTHLRLHYQRRHGFIYPILKTSVSRAKQIQHDRGLHWLATCVHRDAVFGDSPVVPD